MLLYRPLLAAHRATPLAGVRRFLLRELASPVFHVEPDEVLEALGPPGDDAARMAAQAALSERALRLRLTTRDPDRALGGLWTCQAAGRALVERTRLPVSEAALIRAGGAQLAPVAKALIRHADAPTRARALVTLGCCGPDAALGPLSDELAQGRTPDAAAVGFSLMGSSNASLSLFRAVQIRGLESCESWIATTLSGLASPDTLPLLRRLASSDHEGLRLQAARALECFPVEEASTILEAFGPVTSPLLRLELLSSLGRLGLPGGRSTLDMLAFPTDPDILRVTALRAASASSDPSVRDFVTRALDHPHPLDRAAALESLVILGGVDAVVIQAARRAAAVGGGRLLLVGLLALAVWAPGEALDRARELLRGTRAEGNLLAAYALRYVRTPATVSLLMELCEESFGSTLMEILLSALCRHLDDPRVAPFLVHRVGVQAHPTVAHRVLTDLARHLPGDQAPETAQAVRDLLLQGDSGVVGPALVALGALGSESDRGTLEQALVGPNGQSAIHGLELLMDPGALTALREVSRTGSPEIRPEALAARYRLGDVEVVGELMALTRTPGAELAGRVLFDAGLTLRCVHGVSRLALLHRVLGKESRGLNLDFVDRPGRRPGDSARVLDLDTVLSLRRETALPGLAGAAADPGSAGVQEPTPPPPRTVPPGRGHRPQATAPETHSVYMRLGGAWLGEGIEAPRSLSRLLLVVALVIAGAFLGLRFFAGQSAPEPTKANAPSPRSSQPLLRVAHGQVLVVGDVVTSPSGATRTLETRYPDNRLVVRGSLRVVRLDDGSTGSGRAVLGLDLSEGTVWVVCTRGRTSVALAAAGAVVDVRNGRIRIDLEGPQAVVTAISGSASVEAPGVRKVWVRAGQRARFREGRMVGSFEWLERVQDEDRLSLGLAIETEGSHR